MYLCLFTRLEATAVIYTICLGLQTLKTTSNSCAQFKSRIFLLQNFQDCTFTNFITINHQPICRLFLWHAERIEVCSSSCTTVTAQSSHKNIGQCDMITSCHIAQSCKVNIYMSSLLMFMWQADTVEHLSEPIGTKRLSDNFSDNWITRYWLHVCVFLKIINHLKENTL